MIKKYLVAIIISFSIASYGQDFEWVKQLGNSSSDNGESIITDQQGNVYITGRFQDTVDFDPGIGVYNLTSEGIYDIFVQKLDSNGNFIWAKSIGGSESDSGRKIAVDNNGNVYITGHFGSTVDFNPGSGIQNFISNGLSDIFILKLNSDGDYIWAKTFGGDAYDFGRSIAINNSSEYIYMTGMFVNTVDFNPEGTAVNLTSVGMNDTFIQKLDSNGNLIWIKSIGGINSDNVSDITIDSNEDIYTTGNFRDTADFDPSPNIVNHTSQGLDDAYIQKFDSDGNFLWVKTFGGTSSSDYGSSIITDQNNNVYTTGTFSSTVDFNPGIGIENLTSEGLNDIFIQKLDSNGNFLWVKQMGGTSVDEGKSISLDSNGDIYTTGRFNNTVDFNPNSGVENLTSEGSSDIFIQKLDSNGNFLWVKQMGGTSVDGGNSITIDGSGNVYTTGYFYNTVDFDPGTSVTNLTSLGEDEVFIHKLGSTLSVNDYSFGSLFKVYPNPTEEQTIINFNNLLETIEVNIIDAKGLLLTTLKYDYTDIINLELDYPSGLYFIKIITPKGEKTVSLIKK